MTKEEINKVLQEHKKWLNSDGKEGTKAVVQSADLHGADLCGADLRYANLRGADLCGADLGVANLLDADLDGANLRYANLRNANLRYANLRYANLRYANLRGADLGVANLCGADLMYANLGGANLDYSCIPLQCGSLNVMIDEKIAAQLMYHAMRAMQSVEGSQDVDAVLSDENCIRLANRFHRVDECGRLSPKKEVGAK